MKNRKEWIKETHTQEMADKEKEMADKLAKLLRDSGLNIIEQYDTVYALYHAYKLRYGDGIRIILKKPFRQIKAEYEKEVEK